MTNRIFRSIFLVALAVMLSVSALIMGMMYGYSSMDKQEELRREAAILAAAVESDGLAALERLGVIEHTRITWIGADFRIRCHLFQLTWPFGVGCVPECATTVCVWAPDIDSSGE